MKATSHKNGYKVNGLKSRVSVVRSVIVRVRVVLKRTVAGDSTTLLFRTILRRGRTHYTNHKKSCKANTLAKAYSEFIGFPRFVYDQRLIDFSC